MRLTRGVGVGGGGIGVIALALVASYFLGIDPLVVLQGVDSGGGTVREERAPVPPGQEELAEFVSVVLADTEDTWRELFATLDRRYQEPTLVLFTDAVRSACGFAEAAVGPFYCPADARVYIDLGFYAELRERFEAPGDFAQAYVIAHEVGHHVQHLLGIAEQMRARARQVGRAEANALSVRFELQADCLAGVWAHHADRARGILERGDVAEGLNAASSIGDDRLQRRTTGTIVPESFTHGSSEQRVRWFRRGLETGALTDCDTFAASAL